MNMKEILGEASIFFSVSLFWFFLLLQIHPVGLLQQNVVTFLAITSATLPFSAAANAHLLDVHNVFTVLRVLFAFSIPFTFWAMENKHARRLSGWFLILIPILLACAPWNALFSGMHTLLFPQGNWMFPAQSLLIQTYPQTFFLGFSAAWGVLCIVSGAILLKITSKSFT